MIVLKPGRVPSKTTIRRLRIKGLHGYLDKDIRFNSNINLLVGINGSGKTSVLNIVSWLLRPAIPQLCITEFKEIILELVQNRKAHRVRCIQTSTQFKLFVETRGTAKFHPLVVELQRPAGTVRTPREQQELLDAYAGLQPVRNEHKAWNFLQRLPSPIVVGLERTLGSERLELHISAAKARSLGHPSKAEDPPSDSPLRHVQDLATRAFTRYRAQLIQLNEELRDKITLAAFDIGPVPSASRTTRTRGALLTDSQIADLEERVSRYFSQESQLRRSKSRQPKPAAIAKEYFRKLKKLLQLAKKQGERSAEGPLWPMISDQVRKTNRLFLDFERFDAASKKAYAEIDSYLVTLNRFFQDSGKKLKFDFDTGILMFEMATQKSETNKVALRSIELLSSGEKQIAILFTYLTFSPGKIFIIDEPEISLHPRWQEEFLDSVTQVMPRDTQLIIATHSPAIVGRHTEYCKTLFPYNE